MSGRLTLVVALVLFIGCRPKDDSFPGYATASGDFVPFALDAAVKYGARPRTIARLPKFEAEWRYSSDKDGIQIYLLGDRTGQLASFLLAAFGSPALQKTNTAGQISAGVYAATAIGAVVQYGQEEIPGRGLHTTLVIVRQNAIKP